LTLEASKTGRQISITDLGEKSRGKEKGCTDKGRLEKTASAIPTLSVMKPTKRERWSHLKGAVTTAKGFEMENKWGQHTLEAKGVTATLLENRAEVPKGREATINEDLGGGI